MQVQFRKKRDREEGEETTERAAKKSEFRAAPFVQEARDGSTSSRDCNGVALSVGTVPQDVDASDREQNRSKPLLGAASMEETLAWLESCLEAEVNRWNAERTQRAEAEAETAAARVRAAEMGARLMELTELLEGKDRALEDATKRAEEANQRAEEAEESAKEAKVRWEEADARTQETILLAGKGTARAKVAVARAAAFARALTEQRARVARAETAAAVAQVQADDLARQLARLPKAGKRWRGGNRPQMLVKRGKVVGNVPRGTQAGAGAKRGKPKSALGKVQAMVILDVILGKPVASAPPPGTQLLPCSWPGCLREFRSVQARCGHLSSHKPGKTPAGEVAAAGGGATKLGRMRDWEVESETGLLGVLSEFDREYGAANAEASSEAVQPSAAKRGRPKKTPEGGPAEKARGEAVGPGAEAVWQESGAALAGGGTGLSEAGSLSPLETMGSQKSAGDSLAGTPLGNGRGSEIYPGLQRSGQAEAQHVAGVSDLDRRGVPLQVVRRGGKESRKNVAVTLTADGWRADRFPRRIGDRLVVSEDGATLKQVTGSGVCPLQVMRRVGDQLLPLPCREAAAVKRQLLRREKAHVEVVTKGRRAKERTLAKKGLLAAQQNQRAAAAPPSGSERDGDCGGAREGYAEEGPLVHRSEMVGSGDRLEGAGKTFRQGLKDRGDQEAEEEEDAPLSQLLTRKGRTKPVLEDRRARGSPVMKQGLESSSSSPRCYVLSRALPPLGEPSAFEGCGIHSLSFKSGNQWEIGRSCR